MVTANVVLKMILFVLLMEKPMKTSANLSVQRQYLIIKENVNQFVIALKILILFVEKTRKLIQIYVI